MDALPPVINFHLGENVTPRTQGEWVSESGGAPAGAAEKTTPAAGDGFCLPVIGRVTLGLASGHFSAQTVRREFLHSVPRLSSISTCVGPTQRRDPVSSSIGGQPPSPLARCRDPSRHLISK